MSVDVGSMPPELISPAQILVGLAGLDARNNAIHRSIWDAFSANRRPERPIIQYKLLPNNYEFPVCKPKRTSYEWYLPKGILKRNWLPKHLNLLPALVVVFFELEWSDPSWAERRLECASRIQSIRAALQGRNTRLGLALIQKAATLPSTENVQTSERAAALCNSCDISPKMLFVLPHNDHLVGYAQRLESAFLECCHSYYQQMSRSVKGHKDHLTSAHQNLKTRHQFKIAILAEIRQDYNAALKHYTQAYSILDDIRIIDTNCSEIKTVAGYINYKICRTMFLLDLPRDAISQFKSHIERYRSRIGCRELIFEHHSWMSAQYNAFAELFCEAVRNGLPAIQTQHPGFYYHLAAKQSMQRKISILQISSANPSLTELPISSTASLSEFYGVRSTFAPVEPITEQQLILGLQRQELAVDHAGVIIGLLGSAISQFKAYRCPRMRRRIVVEMAEQYLLCGDTGKALTLFTHMLSDYRAEGLMDLWRIVHSRALYASCMSASVQDYLSLCVEGLSEKLIHEDKEQTRIAQNMYKVLECNPPDSEPLLQLENALVHLPSMTPQVIDLWRNTLMNTQKVIINMDNIAACVEARASFKIRENPAGLSIPIQLILKSNSKIALQFIKAFVILTVNKHTIEVPILSKDSTLDFMLNPNQTMTLMCEAKSDYFLEGVEVQITSISLQMGNERVLIIMDIAKSVTCQNKSPLTEFQNKHIIWEFDTSEAICTAVITARPSNLFCETIHNAPGLKGEWHEISLNLHNKQGASIFDVRIAINAPEQQAEFSLDPSITQEINENYIQISLPKIAEDVKMTQIFFVRCQQICNLATTVKTSYRLTTTISESNETLPIDAMRNLSINSLNTNCSTEHIIVISIVEPFEVSTQFLSSDFKEIQNSYIGDKFLIMTDLVVKSPWPLIIENSTLEVLQPLSLQENGPASQLKGLSLRKDEHGAEVIGLKVNDSFENDDPLKSEIDTAAGIYHIMWRRKDSSKINKTTISMPNITIKNNPVHLEAVLPAKGLVRNSLPLKYYIRSRSDELMHLHAILDVSEAFMFSGHKEMQITLLPHGERVISFNLFPLLCGYVPLPKFIITTENTEQLLSHDLPSHIYIMPQIKCGKQKMECENIIKPIIKNNI